MTMSVVKYHALGNDYLVVDSRYVGVDSLTPPVIARLCDRHHGFGGDGLLWGPADSHNTVRIFNSDGSWAENSGNGTHIFARYLWDTHQADRESFTVWAHGIPVSVTISAMDGSIMVDANLGEPQQHEPLTIMVNQQSWQGTRLSWGNPHFVITRDHVSRDILDQWGPLLEKHPTFPQRTNVQFMNIVGPDTIRIEIWERDSGYTLSSGNSAAAAAAVAWQLGVQAPTRVMMPGGILWVRHDPNTGVWIRGPVVRVFTGVCDPECLGVLETGL
ncbi:diaminopimelate epimerase [Sulfobacillus thermosulfidooxidans]|uniref:diaminopimelate epimerase n=1 Tax=Sulfobacillus thermosulfidooxidans TaxID=28034 RepID=UPI0006B5852D|nr:diaminopimelate epimerase [Sulfobacillus thermosulfidooxidans]